eukprot:CAMPEP_0196758566 /NCGR_PEP_ID=MMETSP1091-20130531/104252_1 /TAXON_ID=302021 /ORGANISM="Rhodomonas sp., Strain CCMP768" /LENGTH=522 /DNA_ID=CAMNT_0042107393 /DNA_START=76 /DNA_END=1641 /DNA_ORIENTATION=+
MSRAHSGGSKTIAVAIVFCIAALALLARPAQDRTELLDKLQQSTQALDSETADASKSVGGKVGQEDLARGILTNARKQFQAKQTQAAAAKKAARAKQVALKKVAAKHQAHRTTTLDGFTLDAKAQAQLAGKKVAASAPTSSLLKRMPAYLNKKEHQSRATKLETAIASHKLTTRGLIAAVQKAEQSQMKELNTGLKDQTDDLIIAKINQLKGHSKAANTQTYVLSNALNKQEQSELASGQGKLHPPGERGRTARPQQQQQQQQQAVTPPIQKQNAAIVHATAGSKGGNPEGMLSSYDQELLSKGPAALDEMDTSSPKAPTNMLSQIPSPQYQAPQYQQYQQPAYAAPMQYQQPYGQEPYQQMYQQPPAYGQPAPYQEAPYQQAPYQQAPYQQAYQYPEPYQYGQPYQPPAQYQEMYQQPQYQAQPYEAQPAYQQPAPYQEMYQQAAAPPPQPAAPAAAPKPAAAAVPAGSEYGESAAVASHQYDGSSGGKLWQLFSSGIGDAKPPGGGGGGAMEGLSQSGSG